MIGQREQRRILVDLSAVKLSAKRLSEPLRDVDFTMLDHFGLSGVDLTAEVVAAYDVGRYVFDVRVEGRVRMLCDRCDRLFWFPLTFREFLEVRRDAVDEVLMDGDEWFVPEDLEVLDLLPYIEESLYLELPMRRYHGMVGTCAEDCDAEMLSYIGAEWHAAASGLDELSLAKLASLRDAMEKQRE